MVGAKRVVMTEDDGQDRRSGSIQVLRRAAAILEAVVQSRGTPSGAALAREVGLNKSTAFNILATLVDLGFLSVAPEDRQYRLGPLAFELASAFQASFVITSIAPPYLDALRDDTGETVSVHVRSGWDRVCVLQAPSLQPITRIIALGRRRPLYSGAAGAVLLAGLEDSLGKMYLSTTELKPLTPNTVVGPERLWQKVQRARESGYAEAFEESEVGVNALAVPIRDQSGSTEAALVVSGPAIRYNSSAIKSTLAAARSTAAAISRELGWIEPVRASVDGAKRARLERRGSR